jgi:hypothetical protein
MSRFAGLLVFLCPLLTLPSFTQTSERILDGSYEGRVSAMSLVLCVLSSDHTKLGPAKALCSRQPLC